MFTINSRPDYQKGNMKCSIVLRLFVFALVAVTWVSSASIERFESESPAQTAVIDLLDVLNERRSSVGNKHVEYQEEEEYYYDDDDEDEFSGDYPLVAFSSKPKDPSAVLNAERHDGLKRKGLGRKKAKGKGKGNKRNPCLKKYKDFCIHGTCQYLRDIGGPSCICDNGYSGERCHSFSLEVRTTESVYNRTTALAVVAVVLSSLCLTIIGLLLALRFHKRGAYNVESEEKIKLGAAPHH